jgi:PAS domain-containing protein
MTQTVRGGTPKPIEAGLLERIGQRLRATIDVWFGPLAPLSSVTPANTPPRRFDYPSGVNLVTLPRTYEAVSFQQMRALADSLDLVRIAIETRKDQVSKMPWSFRAKGIVGVAAKTRAGAPGSTSEPGSTLASGSTSGKIDALTEFFRCPDGEHEFDDWLRMIVEDLLVIDAVTLAATIDERGSVWSPGHKVQRFEVIDGATIKRVIDDMGRTPAAPATAYQQILKGVPATDFTADELTYRPRNPRAHKFYGYSPVEQIIITINVALRRQMFTLAYFTDGNVPEAICQSPETWNPDTIRDFQDWFDSTLAGNLAQRRRITFIPNSGGKDALQFTKEPPLSSDLDEWLARIVCWAFSISPQALIKQMNRATAETAKEQAEEEGIAPLLNWLASLINSLVRKYFGYDDVEFAWGERRDENKLEQAQINQIYVQSGILTVDEIRESLGKPAVSTQQSAKHQNQKQNPTRIARM